MPKRSHETTGAMDKVQKKTERSHEENQERAYIAASRRADRSIEARVQSARMASSIHKKRTGRGFKVTEEIVMKEEMYEEEEDEFPRHFRALTAHLQTGSVDMNNKLNAYVSNHVALANLAHQQQVDRMFAEQFPNAAQISRRLSTSMNYQSRGTDQTSASSFSPLDYSPNMQPCHKARSQSMVVTASNPLTTFQQNVNHSDRSPVVRNASADDTVSPPALTPNSGVDSETPLSNATPIFTAAHSFPATGAAVDPLVMDHMQSTSAFTAELPAETKMLASFDPTDPLTGAYYGNTGELMGSDAMFNYIDAGTGFTMADLESIKAEPSEYFAMPPSRHMNFTEGSRIGTPGGGQGGDSWESWVQYD